jgi:hypothetical protein
MVPTLCVARCRIGRILAIRDAERRGSAFRRGAWERGSPDAGPIKTGRVQQHAKTLPTHGGEKAVVYTRTPAQRQRRAGFWQNIQRRADRRRQKWNDFAAIGEFSHGERTADSDGAGCSEVARRDFRFRNKFLVAEMSRRRKLVSVEKCAAFFARTLPAHFRGGMARFG